LYIRGVTNGGDGVKVGSQPLVGVYIDEMPVTTIGNNLDLHVYDMARIEALSGPQGTLFGASSMAGTVRLITNKPDRSQFDAGVNVTGTHFTDGGPGGKLEGFVNLPLGDRAAVRLVGWGEHDGGYINVVRNSPQYFPTSGIVRDDAPFVKKDSNGIDTAGARGALKIDHNDSWTATTTLMTQGQKAFGQQAYTPAPVTLVPSYPNGTQGTAMVLGGTGDLNIARYAPEINRDD
jgi:outer membrane receptor protein involved in Fe transport